MQPEIRRRVNKFIHCAIFVGGIIGNGFLMLNSFEGNGTTDLLGIIPATLGLAAALVALVWRIKSY